MEELLLILEAVDRTEAAVREATDRLDKMASKTKESQEKSQKAFDETGVSVTELNQGLELLQKGFGVISAAAQGSISHFKDLVSKSFELVDAFDVQATGISNLESVLRAQGEFTPELSQQFQDLASSWQDVTRVGDEALLPQMARLSAFIGTNVDDMDAATGAAIDLSTAFGSSLEGGFSKLIKAVNSGSLELAEGVSVQLQATDSAERLAEAIGFVEDRFGGAGRAAALVGAGPIIQLKNSFGDLQEELGRVISESPEFEAFINTAKEVVAELAAILKDDAAGASELFGAVFQLSMEIAVRSAGAFISALSLVIDQIIKVQDVLELLQLVDSPFEKIRDRFSRDAQDLIDAADRVQDAFDFDREDLVGVEDSEAFTKRQLEIEDLLISVTSLGERSEVTAGELRDMADALRSVDPSEIAIFGDGLSLDQIEGLASGVDKFASSLELLQTSDISLTEDALGKLFRVLEETNAGQQFQDLFDSLGTRFTENLAKASAASEDAEESVESVSSEAEEAGERVVEAADKFKVFGDLVEAASRKAFTSTNQLADIQAVSAFADLSSAAGDLPGELDVVAEAIGDLSSRGLISVDVMESAFRDLGLTISTVPTEAEALKDSVTESLDAGAEAADDLDESLSRATDTAREAKGQLDDVGRAAARIATNIDVSVDSARGANAQTSGSSIVIDAESLDAAARAVEEAADVSGDSVIAAAEALVASGDEIAAEISAATDDQVSSLDRMRDSVAASLGVAAGSLDGSASRISSAASAIEVAARELGRDAPSPTTTGAQEVFVSRWIAPETVSVRVTNTAAATGAVVTQPTILQVAEGASAEGIIPLNDQGAGFLAATMRLALGQAGFPISGSPQGGGGGAGPGGGGGGGGGLGGTHLHLHADRLELNPEAFESQMFEMQQQLSDRLRDRNLLGV